MRAAFKVASKDANVTDPWDEIAQAIKTQQEIFPNLSYLERMRAFPSHLAQFARTLVRAATPRAAPAAPRGRDTLERDLGVRC